MQLTEEFTHFYEQIRSQAGLDGGGSWDKVQRATFLLHHEENLDHLKSSFARLVGAQIPETEYTFVGTRQGKRLEVELTAKLS